jgi:hypothetical protein
MGADEPAWAANAAAPVDAKYIVGLANATLSAEKVKPQLYNNYDIDDTPASPNAMDDEFDDSSLDVKWTKVNDPAGANAISETAFPGYVWVGLPELVTHNYANLVQLYQAAPATGNFAMTIIAKVALSMTGLPGEVGEWSGIGIGFINSTDSEAWFSNIEYNDSLGTGFPARAGAAKSVAGALSGASTVTINTIDATKFIYLKIEKTTTNAYTSANTYNAYYSFNGIVWQQTGTESFTFTHTCDRVGILFICPKAQANTPLGYAVVDFFRRTV